jgi:hypothetical protein
MSSINPYKAEAVTRAHVFVLALGAALLFSATEPGAQEHASDRHPAATGVAHPTLAALEDAFWVCDHAATTYGVLDMGTAATCAAATSDFRLRKFNGDFNAMLTWWQRNKVHRHQLLEMRDRAAARR